MKTVPHCSWPSESERMAGFHERCGEVLEQALADIDPQDSGRGGLFHVAAALHAGCHLDWARKRLRTLNEKPTGAMFWMHPMVLIMYAGEAHLDDEDEAFIRELWRTYFPFRGDTENHWLIYYASLYLAAQKYPDAGAEAWYNGKSSVENMDEARDYIFHWMRVTTQFGQGEFDSPNYIEEYVRPLGLLVGWCEDGELRLCARMMLDYILFDFAAESLNGLYGGAHSRLYPRHALQPAITAAAALGWLLFGIGDYAWDVYEQNEYQSNAGSLILALSGYSPPAILHRVALDRSKPYIHRELKRTRWRLRNAGPDAFEIDGRTTSPVYKYTYVHPDFILGSSQGGLLQPIQQQTWSLIWNEAHALGKSNTMFGLQPYSSPLEGTMYFVADWDTVTDLIARSKVDYASPDKLEGGSPFEQVFQHKAALIALYDIPAGTRFPHIHTLFSRDLRERIEDHSGWIFARAGAAFLAYRPFASGEWRPVDWTGLLKGGAGDWFSSGFAELSEGSELFVSPHLKNGYLLQVASARDFVDYAAFQAAIRRLPLEFRLEPRPTVTFTTLDGTRLAATYGQPLMINGEAVDYQSWPLFDGPFGAAAAGSQQLEIRYGTMRHCLDFEDVTRTSTVK